MKKTSSTIIFFGNERLATGVTTEAPVLRSLLKEGYNIAAVVANHQTGNSRNVRDLEIATLAQEHNIPVLLPTRLADIANQLQAYKPTVGILVAYGRMIPQAIIDLFPKGIINIHPSLLPLHRGPTPLESVLLQGSTKTGVSIMRLVSAMDAGPVFAQQTVMLRGNETKQELADQLSKVGSQMLLACLPNILDNSLSPKEQDESSATYDALLTKDQGQIDWEKPAEQLEREIRAFAEWPKSRTQIGSIDVIITAARTIDLKGKVGQAVDYQKQLVIYCGTGALVIKSLKPAGKKEMSGEAFLAGYKTQFAHT